jgi:hypothetical protein
MLPNNAHFAKAPHAVFYSGMRDCGHPKQPFALWGSVNLSTSTSEEPRITLGLGDLVRFTGAGARAMI